MNTLEEMAKAYNNELRDSLQLMYDSITNKGVRKKMLKNERLRALLDRYGVNYSLDGE